MKNKSVLLVGLLMGMAANSQAAIISGYGIEVSTSTANNCPSFCTGDFQYHSDGGEFSTSATSSENSYGSASSSALYTGSSTTYLPELRVNTSSDLGKRAGANAFGVQGYTYSGADTTMTLNFNLHGSVGNNDSGLGDGLVGSYASNRLRADIAVIFTSTLDWYPSFATLVYEVAGGPFIDQSVFINNGLDQNAVGSLTFDLVDGMDFYVVASMGASAQNGFADASNTLTMQFVDDTGLVAASVSAVPVPAAVWLFGSGLIGLVGIARRKASV